MALIKARYGWTGRDARGQTGRMSGYYLFNNTSGADRGSSVIQTQAICAAMQALSNLYPIEQSGLASVILNPAGLGGNVTFPNAEDKAVLSVLTQAFTITRFSVPAPKAAIFLADGETVDPANGLVTALIGALTAVDAGGGTAVSNQGAAFLSLIGGARARRRFQRKTTIWTLDPTLTDPEE